MDSKDTTNAVIEAHGLTKIFRDFWGRPKVCAVNSLDMVVRQGEVFGLLGPNGSGKSTTLKMILGLLYPSRGELRVLGCSPRDVRVKARIGYMPEETYLYKYLSGEEILDFYARLCKVPGSERQQRIEELLTMVGLRYARRRRVGEFSKGMARRIGLAQALLNDPELVLLDEPTSGLDPLGCRQVKNLILALARRGKTILVSSHRLADMQDVCDRVAVLCDGSLCAEGPVRDLLRKPEAWRLTIPAVPDDKLKRILAFLAQETGRQPSVEHPAQSLEQFFIEIVARQQPSQLPGPDGAGTEYALAPFLRGREIDTPDHER